MSFISRIKLPANRGDESFMTTAYHSLPGGRRTFFVAPYRYTDDSKQRAESVMRLYRNNVPVILGLALGIITLLLVRLSPMPGIVDVLAAILMFLAGVVLGVIMKRRAGGGDNYAEMSFNSIMTPEGIRLNQMLNLRYAKNDEHFNELGRLHAECHQIMRRIDQQIDDVPRGELIDLLKQKREALMEMETREGDGNKDATTSNYNPKAYEPSLTMRLIGRVRNRGDKQKS